MALLKIYEEDLGIAQAIVRRDAQVTRQYFYRQCFPLFRSVFLNYYTDSTDVKEFIDEIYVLLVAPNRDTGHCQMENFKGESSLAMWIKVVCLNYCRQKFRRRQRIVYAEPMNDDDEKKSDEGDRFALLGESIEMDNGSINRHDVETILQLMPNKRYSQIIRLRYLDMKTNEEIAEQMQISMQNYYNVHKRAKAQYETICRKEDYYG